MPEATICPFVLLVDPSTPYNSLNKQFLDFAKKHLDNLEKHDIDIYISKKTFSYIYEMFPWKLRNDNRRSQHISMWLQSVLVPLNKKIKKIENLPFDYNARKKFSFTCGVESDHRLCNSWIDWLSFWYKPPLINNKSLKGLVVGFNCSKHEQLSELCQNYTTVYSNNDWGIVIYPWYHKYKRNLPAEGDFPFKPPLNWQSHSRPLLGKNHGYLDENNNEWIWCKKHKNHWDVQLVHKRGRMRITPNGTEL